LNFHYNGSLQALLNAVYPGHLWLPWRFPKTPKSYWKDVGNHKKFVKYLGEQLKVREGHLEDWYKLSTKAVVDNGGGGLLSYHYDNSVFKLLSSTFPDYSWNPWKFGQVSKDYWISVENQKAFLDDVGSTLGFKQGDMSGWYSISNEVVFKHGGKALLSNIYKGSLYSLLVSVYPDHKWIPWRFKHTTRDYWSSIENQKLFVLELGRQFGFDDENLEGWYSVTNRKLIDNGAQGILSGYYDGSMIRLLSTVYPDHYWDPSKFIKTPKYGSEFQSRTSMFS
jgi:hypothetical protein